jgi:glycosyltransferase 2 family protein
MHSHLRRTILTSVKFVLAVAILVYLVFKGRDAFAQLSARTIDWPLLAGALGLTLVMAAISYVRWHILIRAVGIEARLVDTLRLGALGFALNFVSPGSIGGDFFKAIFLAHGHPGRRPEAIATVIIDRIMGLLTMLLLASVGILAVGLLKTATPNLKIFYEMILLSSAVLTSACILFLAIPALTGPVVIGWTHRIPVAGRAIARMLATVPVYRTQKWKLVGAFVLSIVMALFYVSSYYLVARGLPIQAPTWSEHLVIVPMAGLVGAVPLTPNGLGTTELAIEELYKRMPGVQVSPGDGTLVGIGRRVTDIAVALIGLTFYLGHRREVSEVFAEAEQVADAEE